MNRRAFLASLALAAATGAGRAAQPEGPEIGSDHPLQAAWTAWKAAYLAPEGRVVDAFQNGASHSEGQGFGMTLATFFDDEQAFDLMREWTEWRLAARPDGLLAWRWRVDAGTPALDMNNASDGDLLCAWALMRAAALFEKRSYAARARELAQALARHCVVDHPDGASRLLLPAVEGFRREASVVINPSYIVPRAMRDLAAFAEAPELALCADDGVAMLAALAVEGLIPDWIEATRAGFAPAAGFSADNGYEAMRVGLYLAWSGHETHPAIVRQLEGWRAADLRERAPGAPTVMETRSLRVLERSAHPGYAALPGLLECLADTAIGAAIPPFTTAQPYYPATLHLLALVAQAERFPRCLPL